MSSAWCNQRRGIAGWLLWVVVAASVGLSSCAPARALSLAAAPAPEWRIGDRWRHGWTAGTDRGVKTSEVLGLREVGGARYYVLRVDAVNRYYTLDLHWAAVIAEGRVAARTQPPQPWFMWPLEVGKRWEYQGTYEDQEQKQSLRESYEVVGVEEVDAPAGKFLAFKLTRQGTPGSWDQYWYAPEVRWYVKWVGHRGSEEFQEILQEYAPGSGTPQPGPSQERLPGSVK